MSCFARGCMEKYSGYDNAFYLMACCKSDEVSVLRRMKIHRVLKKQRSISNLFCPNIGTKENESLVTESHTMLRQWSSGRTYVKKRPHRWDQRGHGVSQFCKS